MLGKKSLRIWWTFICVLSTSLEGTNLSTARLNSKKLISFTSIGCFGIFFFKNNGFDWKPSSQSIHRLLYWSLWWPCSKIFGHCSKFFHIRVWFHHEISGTYTLFQKMGVLIKSWTNGWSPTWYKWRFDRTCEDQVTSINYKVTFKKPHLVFIVSFSVRFSVKLMSISVVSICSSAFLQYKVHF